MTNLEAWFKEMIRLHGLNRIVEDVVSDNEGCVAAAAFKGEDCGMRQHDCQECMKDLQKWLMVEVEDETWRADEPPIDQMVLVTFLDDQDRRYVRMAALDDTGEYWADDLPFRDRAIAWRPVPDAYNGPVTIEPSEDEAELVEKWAIIGMVCARELAKSSLHTLDEMKRIFEEWQKNGKDE